MSKSRVVLAIAIFALFAPLALATVMISAATDAPKYSPGAAIGIEGYAINSDNTTASLNVNVSVYNGTLIDATNNDSTTDSAGYFTAAVTAPSTIGNYNITIAIGDGRISMPIEITNARETKLFLVNTTDGYFVATLGSCAAYIYDNTEITGTVIGCGNFTYAGTNYCVLAQNDSNAYGIFVDDDTVFNFTTTEDGQPLQKFLGEGAGVDLGNTSATVGYIDPYGGEVELVRLVTPAFSGGESAKAVGVVLNGTGKPIANHNTTFTFRNSTGGLEGAQTVYNTTGAADGAVQMSFTISDTGGVHFVQVGSDQISYKVNKFTMTPMIRDIDGNDVAYTAPGATLYFTASVTSSSTQAPIDTATAIVKVSGPNGYLRQANLTYNATTLVYESNYSAPSTAGQYKAEFVISYSGATSTSAIPFEISPYDILIYPISKGKDGAGQGFPVNQPGMILVGARNLSTGAFVNISTATSNCSEQYLGLLGLYDADGNDKKGNLSSMMGGASATRNIVLSNFSNFVGNMSGGAEQPPDEILESFNNLVGNDACAIMFAAPGIAGVYTAKINTTIDGLNKISPETVRVQSFFVDAFPMSSRGGFQNAFSPGQRIYLGVTAYDPNTGQKVDAANITNIELVEVGAEGGTIVTAKMVNVTTSTVGEFKAVSFIANDSVMGHHFVHIKVTANINGSAVQAYGDGFFSEQLYRTWAYPAGMKMAFGGSENVTMKVEVRDSSGMNAQSGITVSLASVTNMNAFQTINSTSANACTTDSNGACQLNITNTQTWKSGGYNVRVKIKDSNNNTDYGYGWFQVSNFMFWAYTESFEASTTQNITFKLNARYFNGTALSGTAMIEKVMYFGSSDSWTPPTVANSSISATGTITDNAGTIVLPENSVSQSGQYAVVITANAGGLSETVQSWFMAKPFTTYVRPYGDNWNNAYGIGDTIVFNVTGYESMNWATWPPTGTPHDITDAYITSVEKMGFWGQSFKTKSTLVTQNGMAATCAGNSCNLTFNTTGFRQGEYMLRVVAKDATGSKAEWMTNIRIQSIRIGVPQMLNGMSGISIAKEYPSSNTTSIAITGSCGSSDSDTPIEPANITNCKYAAVRIAANGTLSMNAENHWEEDVAYNYTCFLLDKTAQRLYVINDTVNCSIPDGEGATLANFTVASALNLTTGDTFNDSSQNNWSISSIDFSANTISLQSRSGILITRFMEGQGNANKTQFVRVNNALSKSGQFYYSKRSNELLRESQWEKVDLDANGNYDSWYFLILADPVTAGSYDTLLASANPSDFVAAASKVVLSNATTTDGINFTNTAAPTYLTAIRYNSEGNGSYKVFLSSNYANYGGGQNLGRYKPDSIIRVPVLVGSPADTNVVYANRPVRLKAIKKSGGMVMSGPNGQTFGTAGQLDLDNTNCIGSSNHTGMCTYNTSSAGVALILLNTSTISGLETGSYQLVIEACDNRTDENCVSADAWIGTSNDWENPQVEIRNFEVSGMFGKSGILNLTKISVADGNLDALQSDEMRINGTAYGVDGWCPTLGGVNCARFWDYTFNKVLLYANGSILMDLDNDGQADATDEMYDISAAGSGSRAMVSVVGEHGVHILINITSLAYPQFDFTIAWPYIVGDYEPSSNWKTVRVLNFTEDWSIVLTNTAGRKTAEDLMGWSSPYDSVYVVGANEPHIYNASIAQNNLSLGWTLPVINRSVMRAEMWNSVVLLTNLTLDGRGIRGVRGCDSPVFYFANTTESALGLKLSQDMGMGGNNPVEVLNSTTQYYALFLDDKCDARDAISTMVLAPKNPDFSNMWANGQQWDYDGPSTLVQQNGEMKNYIEVGAEWGWPVRVRNIDETDPANIRARLFKESYGPYLSNQTLSLFVTARYFDGLPVTGNVTLSSITGFTYGPMGPTEAFQNVSGFATITSGEGFLSLNISNLSGGYYNAKFSVAEDIGGRIETLTKDIPINGGMGSQGGGMGGCEGPECGGPQ